MTERILFVDDEKNILDSMKRLLRKRFEVDTALGPTAGLEMMKKGRFAVVVSDLRMPGMDGIEFLSHVRSINQDTVRIMLTGYADLDASIAAVNEGRVFRFLTKPCPDQQLIQTLQAALDQYHLVTAEKELLRDTLKGMVSLLSDVLSNLRPEIYGMISRIRPYIRKLSRKMQDPKPWEVETASMLCLLGFIFLPDNLIAKVDKGKELSELDKQTYYRHAELASELISHIPRMAPIAEIIRYQEKGYDGSGAPYDDVMGSKIPLGARMLKVLLDFDRLSEDDTPKKDRPGPNETSCQFVRSQSVAGSGGNSRRRCQIRGQNDQAAGAAERDVSDERHHDHPWRQADQGSGQGTGGHRGDADGDQTAGPAGAHVRTYRRDRGRKRVSGMTRERGVTYFPLPSRSGESFRGLTFYTVPECSMISTLSNLLLFLCYSNNNMIRL